MQVRTYPISRKGRCSKYNRKRKNYKGKDYKIWTIRLNTCASKIIVSRKKLGKISWVYGYTLLQLRNAFFNI